MSRRVNNHLKIVIPLKGRRLVFAENDVRIPPTILVGAELNYDDNLESAEPCYECGTPVIQFSKTFIMTEMNWTNDYLDPDLEATKNKIEEIAQMVTS